MSVAGLPTGSTTYVDFLDRPEQVEAYILSHIERGAHAVVLQAKLDAVDGLLVALKSPSISRIGVEVY